MADIGVAAVLDCIAAAVTVNVPGVTILRDSVLASPENEGSGWSRTSGISSSTSPLSSVIRIENSSCSSNSSGSSDS